MTEILQFTSILLRFNIFLKRCETKSKINPSLTTYLKYNLIFIAIILMFEFYCIAFREHVITAKCFLDYTNLSSPNDYQHNDKIVYLRPLKTNTTKEKLSLDLRLKNRWNKKLLFRSIKHYDLICEKKKVCRSLNYFKQFIVFLSAVNGCVSIFAFASLVGVSVDIWIQWDIKTVETYHVSCKTNTANENVSVRRTKESRLMLV